MPIDNLPEMSASEIADSLNSIGSGPPPAELVETYAERIARIRKRMPELAREYDMAAEAERLAMLGESHPSPSEFYGPPEQFLTRQQAEARKVQKELEWAEAERLTTPPPPSPTKIGRSRRRNTFENQKISRLLEAILNQKKRKASRASSAMAPSASEIDVLEQAVQEAVQAQAVGGSPPMGGGDGGGGGNDPPTPPPPSNNPERPHGRHAQGGPPPPGMGGRPGGGSGKWATAAKWGGRAFNTLNAIMVPLMLAQFGMEIHDRMGGDVFGQKKRQRGLAADDITHFLNSNMENTATHVREETVLPSLLRTATPYADMGQSMGAQELMQGAAAQNYIATKTQQLGNMAVPMDQTPTLTEMAARMGLPIA